MEMTRNIVIIILSLAIIVLAVFLLIPEYTTFNHLNEQMAVEKAKLDTGNNYYAQIKSNYDSLSSHQADLQKIDEALPASPDLARIIYYLQQESTQSGLTIKSVVLTKSSSGNQAQTAGTIKDIIFSVSLSGNYESLGKFISSLEKSDRIFEVTNISFAAPTTLAVIATKSSPNQLPPATTPFNFNIQVKTHSY